MHFVVTMATQNVKELILYQPNVLIRIEYDWHNYILNVKDHTVWFVVFIHVIRVLLVNNRYSSITNYSILHYYL